MNRIMSLVICMLAAVLVQPACSTEPAQEFRVGYSNSQITPVLEASRVKLELISAFDTEGVDALLLSDKDAFLLATRTGQNLSVLIIAGEREVLVSDANWPEVLELPEKDLVLLVVPTEVATQNPRFCEALSEAFYEGLSADQVMTTYSAADATVFCESELLKRHMAAVRHSLTARAEHGEIDEVHMGTVWRTAVHFPDGLVTGVSKGGLRFLTTYMVAAERK